MSQLSFITGGARSGKSSAAIQKAMLYDAPRVFIATAQALDEEMEQRIAAHQNERNQAFITIDETIDLAAAIEQAEQLDAKVIVIDCLTLWVANLLQQEASSIELKQYAEKWLQVAQQAQCPVIVVSNEVGMGIVPMNELARRFRDEVGWLHQHVAAAADEVEVRFCGLSLPLKKAQGQ